MQTTPVEVRDKREKEWYWMNNEFIDCYGEILGLHAVAIYTVLCRHANNSTQECFPSMETLGKKAGISSRKTVSKAISLLQSYNIIEVEKAMAADGKRLNNVYRLSRPQSWKGYKQVADQGVTLETTFKVSEIAALSPQNLKHAGKNTVVLLPDWFDPAVWDQWDTYRKQKKQKLTPLSIKKQIEFLAIHRADYKAIIDRSITNGWTGLFPLRKDYKKSSTPSKIEAVAGKYSNVKQS